jgi:hypothetical protein
MDGETLTRCMLCNYFFEPVLTVGNDADTTCSICAMRTTAAGRRAFLRGQPIVSSYMDAD